MPRRPEMLASEVRKIIAPVLRTCPPECGVVTITDVDVTPDSSLITVSVSALFHNDVALTYMKNQYRDLRHALRALQMHRIPELRFRIDPRSERGSRVEKLLGE